MGTKIWLGMRSSQLQNCPRLWQIQLNKYIVPSMPILSLYSSGTRCHHFAAPPSCTSLISYILNTQKTHKLLALVWPSMETTDFCSILNLWVGEWCKNIPLLIGHNMRIAKVVLDSMLIAATDGSNIQHLAQEMCALAFVSECKQGTG